MAVKKVYAVRKGRTTGIFRDWESCRAAVSGFAGAEFKGFAALREAEEYLNGGNPDTGAKAVKAVKKPQKRQIKPPEEVSAIVPSEPEALIAYVDGSYDHSLKKYAFGCVFILSDGTVYVENGNGDNPDSLALRNVTGEMLGAMFAVRFAMENGFRSIEIRYDYEGIEKWVTGAWRCKTDLTQKYARAMRSWSGKTEIRFVKVAAHTNVYYNEMADQLAKKALREGNGVPAVRRMEDMEPWKDDGTDETE